MSERIRWEPVEGGMDGYVGAVVPPPFTIHCANLSYADWMLTAELPGDAVSGNDLDELKAEAERWLERFVSSLGAIFPEAGRVIVNEAALDAFVSEADSVRTQRDQEFCCSTAEYQASDAEFKALVDALNITAAPGTSAPRAGEKE